MSFNETDVQSALKNLIDPNTQKDFVSGKSVKNVKVSGSDVVAGYSAGLPGQKRMGRNTRNGRNTSQGGFAGCGQDQRQRVQQSCSARGSARRKTCRRREKHYRGGKRQGRCRQINDCGQSGAGAGCRRRARRRAGCRHLRPIATHHARHFRANPNRSMANPWSR